MAKRANPSKILLMLALGAFTPAAIARPVGPAAKKPAAHMGKKPAAHATSAKPAAHAAAHTRGTARTSETAKTQKASAAHAVVLTRAQSRAQTRAQNRTQSRAQTKAQTRAHQESRSHQKIHAEVRPVAATRVKAPAPMVPIAPTVGGESKPVVVAARPVPAVATPAAPAEEPIVKHDRKHHLPEPQPDNGKAAGQPGNPDTASGSTEATAALFSKNGHLIVPPAMKGSHEILVHQNVMADQDGLGRIQDDDDLGRMRGDKTLLPLPESAGLQSDDRLPANRRFARPWTVKFLEALAKAHYDRFHTALQVNSAARTVEFQRNLMRVNGNAAPAEGETASPHLTGQAVDLAKKGLSMTEIAWMRGYLLPLVQQGKIDVEEEFQQSCFHISVYRKYMPDPAPRREIVSRPVSGSAIAAALR